MAGPGFSGYFMKGLASGIQSGFDVGTKFTQLKWQKKKQKELDDLNAQMADAWNNIGQEIITLANDGQLSEDDLLKVYTMSMAAPYEMQGVMQNLRNSLSQFRTNDFETQMEYVKTFYEFAKGQNPKDINSMYETFRNYITDPHALTLYEVADKKLRHEFEAAKELEPWKKAEMLPSEVRPEYLRTKGVEIPEITEAPKAPAIKDYSDAVNYLSKFINAPLETFNKIKAGFQKQFPDINMSDITQESIREPKEVTTEKERVTSLPQLESYREKILNADTIEDAQKFYNDYADEYDESKLKLNLPKDWVDVKQGDLMDLISVLNTITENSENIKGNKEFTFELNGKAITKTGAEWYKDIYESYIALLKLLEENGVDTSQYKKLKPPSEVKAGFLKGLTTFGGLGKGDLISIYY